MAPSCPRAHSAPREALEPGAGASQSALQTGTRDWKSKVTSPRPPNKPKAFPSFEPGLGRGLGKLPQRESCPELLRPPALS